MEEKTKKLIKIIMPVAVAVVVLAVVLLIAFLPKEVTENSYFKSLTNSNFTKQVQVTTIHENQTLAYEKIETIIFQNNKVYHKIEEKRIATSGQVLYEEILTEYYYANNKIYYYEDNSWKTSDFSLEDNLKTYSLKTDYFSEIEFDKEFEEEGSLLGNIKDENVNDVFNSDTNFSNATLLIKVNNNFKINNLQITVKTATNKDVLITNTYTYNQEVVTLPNI